MTGVPHGVRHPGYSGAGMRHRERAVGVEVVQPQVQYCQGG